MAKEFHLFFDPGKEEHMFSHKQDFLKFSGVFDFDGLYRLMAKWFKDRKYDFYENLYKDKPPELELEWIGERKLDDFYKYKIRLYFHLWDMKTVEAIKDGQKKKLTSCRMIVEFDPSVVVDYQNRWTENAFTEKLFGFYFKNIIKREFQLKIADPLWYISYRLQNVMKEYLEMETRGNAYG